MRPVDIGMGSSSIGRALEFCPFQDRTTPDHSAPGALRFRRSSAAGTQAVFDLFTVSVQRLQPDPYSQSVADSWMSGRAPGDYLADCARREQSG